MHGKHVFSRHDVIHDREHAFFHLTGVFGSQNHHLSTIKMDRYTCRAGHSLDVRLGRTLAGVVNHVIRFAERLEFLLGRSNQHVVHEECVIRSRTDNSNFNSVFRIPTREAVHHVKPGLRIEECRREFLKLCKRRVGQCDVDRAPPDIRFTGRLRNDPLVFRTTARFFARE